MPTVLPMTRVEAYLAYKAGVISESDLKPSLKTNFYSGLENWLAYWCGLTADYPKDENNNPKWYTEEEYYVAYLCGIAPDYPVNCYRRVGAYLRYIISARWDRPEKPLTREEYYLSLMSTTYLPPNEPASVISIDGTAEAPFGDLKIFGDTTQETLTGKNKTGYDYASVKSVNTGSGRVWDDIAKTMTYNGITYKINDDGTILVTGTSSGNSFLVLENPVSGLVSGTEYILTGCPSSGSASTYSLRLYTESTTYVWDGGSGVDFTYGTQDILRVNMSGGTSAPTGGLLFKPMIRLASETNPDYEPYCGGIPSPNPDYPQDVNVVTGEQTVTVTGKNLFDGILESGYINGTTGQNGSNDTLVRDKNYIPVEELTNYKFSCDNSNVTTVYVYEYKADKTYNLSSNKSVSLDSYLTTNAGTAFIRFRPSYITTDTSIKFQVEKGTVATPYEPYQGQSYEINLGKNLVNSTTWRLVNTSGGYPTTPGDRATINSSTANSIDFTVTTNYGGVETDFIPLKNGTTLTVSFKSTGTAPNRFWITQYNSNKTRVSTLNTSTSVGTTTVTTTQDGYIALAFGNTTTGDFVISEIQAELGSVATPYAPYFTPIELCKIVGYQDYIWKDGADWKVHKATAKVTLDGTENWVQLVASGFNNYYLESMATNLYLGDTATYLSNYFTGIPTNDRYSDGTFFINNSGRGVFTYNAITSKDDFKTWLTTHNTGVYYVLATATDTVITDAGLIAQLDALLEGGSYEPQTNITLTAADPNLPGLLQVTAAKWQ